MGAADTFIPAPIWKRSGSALPVENLRTGGEGAHFDAREAAARAEAHAREVSEISAITRLVKLFEAGDAQAQLEQPLQAGKTDAVSGWIYEALAHPRLGSLWSAELFEIVSACMHSGDEKLRNKARALVAHMAMEYASDCTVGK